MSVLVSKRRGGHRACQVLIQKFSIFARISCPPFQPRSALDLPERLNQLKAQVTDNPRPARDIHQWAFNHYRSHRHARKCLLRGKECGPVPDHNVSALALASTLPYSTFSGSGSSCGLYLGSRLAGMIANALTAAKISSPLRSADRRAPSFSSMAAST